MSTQQISQAWQYVLGIVLGFGAVFTMTHGMQQVPGDLVAEAEVFAPPPISEAIDARAELLSRTLNVSFSADKKTAGEMSIALSAHPEWVTFSIVDSEPTAVVSTERIAEYFHDHPMADLKKANTCTILSRWTDEYKVTRAETDCIASAGYEYDVDTIAASIAHALNADESSLTIALTFRAPEILDAENPNAPPLTLLSTGRSEFSNSPDGRVGNVKKGLDERLQNVWVPQGATFSFNPILGDMGAHTGWYMAPTIFERGEIRSAPGGGICQVSTTLYRAALRAGLPIVQQKNHSLYVFHYEEYGAGLDATVFTDKQDFKFQNNSGGPLLIQTRYEGTEAYVSIYGYDDGRSVTMEGPFFLKTSGADAMGEGTDLKINEIGWKRTITQGDTSVTENRIARYNAIPKTLAEKTPTQVEVVKEGK